MSDADVLAEMHPVLLDWARETGIDILWFKVWQTIERGEIRDCLTAFGRNRKTKEFCHNTVSRQRLN